MTSVQNDRCCVVLSPNVTSKHVYFADKKTHYWKPCMSHCSEILQLFIVMLLLQRKYISHDHRRVYMFDIFAENKIKF